jgi:hypothetical protein
MLFHVRTTGRFHYNKLIPTDGGDSMSADPTDPTPRDRLNPSVESTKLDDAHVRRTHQDEEIAGAAVGAGVGCLGMALLPWVMIAAGIVAAVVVALVAGWFK